MLASFDRRNPAHLIPATVAVKAVPGRDGRARLAAGFGPWFFMALLFGLLWLGPAWWEPRFLVAMALWDLLILVAWFVDLRSLPRPEQLEVRRVWKSPAALSVESHVGIEVVNHGRVSIIAKLEDDVAIPLRPEPATLEIRVAAGGTDGAEYLIRPSARGDAIMGRVYLRYQSTLRLAERWASADLAQSVRIYPNLEEAKRQTVFLVRSRQVDLEKRRKHQRGLGKEFESLREYRPGDELRDVCWTATARRRHLVTKIYQVERSQAVWIIVDAGRLLRAKVAGLSKLDYTVNAALSLAQVALYSGDRVGLIAYGRKVQQRLAAGRGAPHLRAMVEALAQVHGEPYEADHLRAADALLAVQKRRSLIVWLTDLAETPATPEVIEGAAQMSPRHLVLFGVMGQPELTQLAHSWPADETQMYRHVAALEMVHRRELLLRRLRQQGALALEFELKGLSTALVNQYLDIKERSLL
jgi:uncharacterized protein (DUF58 family)